MNYKNNCEWITNRLKSTMIFLKFKETKKKKKNYKPFINELHLK